LESVAGREGEDEIATEGSGSDMIPKGAWRGWEGKEKDTRTPDHQMEKKRKTRDRRLESLEAGMRKTVSNRVAVWTRSRKNVARASNKVLPRGTWYFGVLL
jgi:hypothetical protein